MSEVEQWKLYNEWTYDNFFSEIKETDSVLELGPLIGFHTELIQRRKPKILKVVEPNTGDALEALKVKTLLSDNQIYNGTANDYYKEHNETFDTVVCCGLLYHLLAPEHLLEQIVNRSKPKRIIISNLETKDSIVKYNTREDGREAFARSDDKGITKPIRYGVSLSADTTLGMLESVGYKCLRNLDTVGIWDKYIYYWQLYEVNNEMG